MQPPHSRALVLLVVVLQGGLASRGRRQKEDVFDIRVHPHLPSHGLRPRPFQPILPNHPLIDYDYNNNNNNNNNNNKNNLSSSYAHLDHQRRRGGSILLHSNQGFPERHRDGAAPGFQEMPELQYQHQKPRTWTARPRLDAELEGTTRDPAIPDNPEGLKNPSLLTGPWEEEPPIRITEAHFKGVNGSTVEAQAGTTAKLPCVIIKRADHETVSWVRMRDHHLITVGRQTYSNDDRFSVNYNRHLNEWKLHIRYAQSRDAGEYICQLSTHPPMVFIFTLTITQASAVITGGPERYVHEGSAVVLTCALRKHTQTPDYVFWYHNRTMINFDTDRQVSVKKTRDGSILTLASVGRTDSGNYTCLPANARPASITLHIILGDAPAAMQVSRSSLIATAGVTPLILIFFLLQATGNIGSMKALLPL